MCSWYRAKGFLKNFGCLGAGGWGGGGGKSGGGSCIGLRHGVF